MTIDLEPVKVIDADTHMTERHDLWTTRAPAAMKDRVPHVDAGRRAGNVGRRDGAVLGRAGAGGVVDKDGKKGRSFEASLRVGDRAGHAAAYDPVARLGAASTRSGSGRRSSSRTSSVSAASTLGDIVQDAGAAQPLPRDLQRRQRRAPGRVGQPPAADGDPARVGHRRVRARGAAREEPRPARRQPHLRSAGPRRRPTSRTATWDPLWEACSDAAAAGALPHRREPHDDELLRRRTRGTSHDDDTKLAIGGTLLFIGNARVVVNIICSGMLDRYPGAQDRVGRERRRLDPVHPRGARLRDGRERAAGDRPRCRCSRRSTSSARSTRRRGSSAATSRQLDRGGRRGQHHVRDRLPAPDVPLPRPARCRRREHARPQPDGPREDPRRERAQLYRL